jgi:hypothetical protein
MTDAAPLPIDDVLGALRTALAEHSSAVLVAPPGAGKRRERRSRFSTSRGPRANASSYSSRAASPPAPPLAWPRRILTPLLYVNIGVMPGSAFAIARRYAGRCPMRSR